MDKSVARGCSMNPWRYFAKGFRSNASPRTGRVCRGLLLGMAVLALISLPTEAATKHGLNAKPYEVLCGLYRVLARPPGALYDHDAVNKTQEEISAFAQKIEELATGVRVSDQDKGESGRGGPSTTSPSERSSVQESGRQSTLLNGLRGNIRLKLALIKVAKLKQQAAKILENVRQEEKAAKLDEIKESFSNAIGESGGADFGIGAGGRASACGGISGAAGTKAKEKLLVNFLCLCAARQTGSACTSGNDACGGECVKTVATNQHWDSSAVTGADTLWRVLKDECLRGHPSSPTTAREGFQAIHKFIAELRGGVSGNQANAKAGYLGTCVAGTTCSSGCNGVQNSESGICSALGSDGQWESSVPWLVHMQTGVRQLALAENATIRIQRDIAHLKILQTQVEQIYEETKATLEHETDSPEKATHDQIGKQHPSAATGKAAAREPNTVSTATITNFILPWTLLL